MNLSLVLFANKDDAPDEVEAARELLRKAAGRSTGAVDKYFGTKLPPVCARLGCYLSDDGSRFYCVNSSCQKHRKRATKHNRTAKPKARREIYFRCPDCNSTHVDLDHMAGGYKCRVCQHAWTAS